MRNIWWFLGALEKLRKAAISFIVSICQPVIVEQLGSQYTNYDEIWKLGIFRKHVKKL
jgi:hypothetical protein